MRRLLRWSIWLSDEGQIDRARGYARPIREDVEIPAELQETMIDNSEYEDTIPLTDNEAVSEICTEIATRWEEEVISADRLIRSRNVFASYGGLRAAGG